MADSNVGGGLAEAIVRVRLDLSELISGIASARTKAQKLADDASSVATVKPVLTAKFDTAAILANVAKVKAAFASVSASIRPAFDGSALAGGMMKAKAALSRLAEKTSSTIRPMFDGSLVLSGISKSKAALSTLTTTIRPLFDSEIVASGIRGVKAGLASIAAVIRPAFDNSAIATGAARIIKSLAGVAASIRPVFDFSLLAGGAARIKSVLGNVAKSIGADIAKDLNLAGLKSSLASLANAHPIVLKVVSGAATSAIAAVRSSLAGLGMAASFAIRIASGAANSAIAAVRSSLAGLSSVAGIVVRVATGAATAAIAAVRGALAGLAAGAAVVIRVGVSAAMSAVSAVRGALAGLRAVAGFTIRIGTAAAKAAIAALRVSLAGIVKLTTLTFRVITAPVRSAFSLIRSMFGGIKDPVISPGVDTGPAESGFSRIKSMMMGALATAGIYVSARGLWEMGKSLAFAADGVEMMKNSYATMLGGGEKAIQQADALVARMRKFAAVTPFTEQSIGTAVTAFLPFSKDADDLFAKVRAIGDAASVSAIGFEAFPRVSRAIMQMFAKSKIQAEEMLQLAEAGIPAWQTLSRAMGKSTSELMDVGRRGKLGVDAINAFVAQLGKDYGGAMEKQSKTVKGMITTIVDSVRMGAVRAFQPIYEAIKPIMKRVVDFVSSPKFGDAMDAIAGKFRAIIAYIKSMASSPFGKAIAGTAVFLAKAAALKIAWGYVGTAIASVVGIVSSLVAAVAPSVAAVFALQKAWQMAMGSKYGTAILEKIGEIRVAVMALAQSVWTAMKGAWGAVVGLFDKWLGKSGELGTSLGDSIGKWTDKLIGFVRDAVNWATTLVRNYQETWNAIRAAAVLAWLKIKEEYMKLVVDMTGATAGKFREKWDTIKSYAVAALTAVGTFAARFFPPVWAELVESFKTAWNEIGPYIKASMLDILSGLLRSVGIFEFDELADKAKMAADEIRTQTARMNKAISDGVKEGKSYEQWRRDSIAELERKKTTSWAKLAKADMQGLYGGMTTSERKRIKGDISFYEQQIAAIQSTTERQYTGAGNAIAKVTGKALADATAASAAEYNAAFGRLQEAAKSLRDAESAAATNPQLSPEDDAARNQARANLQNATDALRAAFDKVDKEVKDRAKKEREATSGVAALGDAANNAAENVDFGRGAAADAAKAAKDKKDGKGGADFVGITELQKRMQSMFGGSKDPMVEQQKTTNDKLDGIRQEIKGQNARARAGGAGAAGVVGAVAGRAANLAQSIAAKIAERKAEKKAEAETRREMPYAVAEMSAAKKRLRELDQTAAGRQSMEAAALRDRIGELQAEMEAHKQALKAGILAEEKTRAEKGGRVVGAGGVAGAGAVPPLLANVKRAFAAVVGGGGKPKTNMEMLEEFKRRVKKEYGTDVSDWPMYGATDEDEAGRVLENASNTSEATLEGLSDEVRDINIRHGKIAADILAGSGGKSVDKSFKDLQTRIIQLFGGDSLIAQEFSRIARAGVMTPDDAKRLQGLANGPGGAFGKKLETMGAAETQRTQNPRGLAPTDILNRIHDVLTREERIALRQEHYQKRIADRKPAGTE